MGMIIWWLLYIVFNFRIKHRVIFQNGAFWRIKAARDMKFEKYFNSFYELFVQQ